MTIQYLECPDILRPRGWLGNTHTVFLAGGISNCRDWQRDIVEMFKDATATDFPANMGSITLVNPRRYNFDLSNLDMSSEQIEWEHFHLKQVDTILFWFPSETLCPITLYELGVAAAKHRTIYVGCDPQYQRKFDVEKQLSLIAPWVKVVDSLEALVDQVVNHVKEF